jgi:hypothetical protein
MLGMAASWLPSPTVNPISFHFVEDNPVPCLFAMLAAVFPWIGTLLLWLARPVLFSQAFGGNWLWPIMAVMFDVLHWAQAGYTNRDRLPGYSGQAG